MIGGPIALNVCRVFYPITIRFNAPFELVYECFNVVVKEIQD